MKKLLLVFAFLFPAVATFAQSDDGRTMMPIYDQAQSLIKNIEDKGNEIVRMEFDLLRDTKETFRMLYSDWTYGIWAFGDYRISDIDVEVYRQVGDTWVSVATDKTASSKAVVSIKPDKDGNYKIVVKAYKFSGDNSVGHYGLMVFHE